MNFLSRKVSVLLVSCMAVSPYASSFELLTEGAMGTVSAVSAESVEEIVNVAGPTAAGLTVDDDDYELLPFQSNIVIEDANPSEVTDGLEFALTQEVEVWATSLSSQGEVQTVSGAVGYIDELPPSVFEESTQTIRDDEFDSIIFDESDQETETSFELSRIEQTVDRLGQRLDTIRYVVERNTDFVATIAPPPAEGQAPSVGSGFISNLKGVSNVTVAAWRD